MEVLAGMILAEEPEEPYHRRQTRTALEQGILQEAAKQWEERSCFEVSD